MALARRPDKVVFTGSAEAGRTILLASSLKPQPPPWWSSPARTPSWCCPPPICSAWPKPSPSACASTERAVCMSPRRLFASRATLAALLPLLQRELAAVPPVALDVATAAKLRTLLADAQAAGATSGQRPGSFSHSGRSLMLPQRSRTWPSHAATSSRPCSRCSQADSMLHALAAVPAVAVCAYRQHLLFAGRETKARSLAGAAQSRHRAHQRPHRAHRRSRVPFGGRGASGYGVTRGAEGLLEMTAVKTLARAPQRAHAPLNRRPRSTRRFSPASSRWFTATASGLARSALWSIRNASRGRSAARTPIQPHSSRRSNARRRHRIGPGRPRSGLYARGPRPQVRSSKRTRGSAARLRSSTSRASASTWARPS